MAKIEISRIKQQCSNKVLLVSMSKGEHALEHTSVQGRVSLHVQLKKNMAMFEVHHNSKGKQAYQHDLIGGRV